MSDAASSTETTRRFYDRISRAYDHLADSSEHAARVEGIEALELQAGESVLEIGFGTGSAVLELAERVAPDGEVCGIDLSPGMLEVALEKVSEAKPQTEVNLRLCDARSIVSDDARFDAAFSSFTLELFDEADIPAVLAEVRRVLKPGGRVAIVSMSLVPSGEHASALEKTYQWMHHHFPHIVDCRPIDPVKHLTDAGLEIVEHKILHIWTMPVAVVLGRRRVA